MENYSIIKLEKVIASPNPNAIRLRIRLEEGKGFDEIGLYFTTPEAYRAALRELAEGATLAMATATRAMAEDSEPQEVPHDGNPENLSLNHAAEIAGGYPDDPDPIYEAAKTIARVHAAGVLQGIEEGKKQ